MMPANRDTYDGTNVIRTPTFGQGFPHADETGGPTITPLDAMAPNGELLYPAGVAGGIASLRPVYVAALHDTGTEVLVGPSSGFCWSEDGSFALQAVVPARAGEDIAAFGLICFAPMYRGAFTRSWSGHREHGLHD